MHAIDRSTDRPIGRTTDRPIDRSIRFNTSIGTLSSTGSHVAYRLLRQPREHHEARIREASGRRARSTDRQTDQSTDRPIDRSTDRPTDSIQYSTLDLVLYRH